MIPQLFRGFSLLAFGVATAWLVARKLPAQPIKQATAKIQAVAVQAIETPAAKRARSAVSRALNKGAWNMRAFSERIVK